ncbi:hypothetical protein C8Q78DRAFT_982357 [Trametes maxima]|nr:hypothetical protein C8Q78DRAFT_982357 [Trametes maxima]
MLPRDGSDARHRRGVLIRVQGIVLYVEDTGEQPPKALSFTKSASCTVSVGRKPSQTSGGDVASDPERALFRCPVVSRKHAKITFTEYGNVYIIDLHSHHGTHIRRTGELVSTALEPEAPTVLANGDQITFGKTVGRDSYLVRPVVVRVQLIFGRDASPRAPSPLPGSLAHDDAASPDKGSVARSNSGRYGVYTPSPESSPSTSDGDSDIQEISPPTSPIAPLPSRKPLISNSNSSSFPGGRLRLLQSLLPPIHAAPLSVPPELDVQLFNGVHVEPPPPAEEEDMDLSSSRSASPAENLDDSEVTFIEPRDPPIVGAWPVPYYLPPFEDVSALAMPSGSASRAIDVIEISEDEYETPSPPSAQGDDADAAGEEDMDVEGGSEDEGAEETDMPAFVSLNDVFLDKVQSIAEATARVQELHAPDAHEASASVQAPQAQTTGILVSAFPFFLYPSMHSGVDAGIVQNELQAIRSTREEDEAAFDAHVQHTKDRLTTLDGQMVDTHARLAERDDQLNSIQSRLQGLGALVSDLQERSTLAEREAARIETLMEEVSAAKDMLKVTCDLQREAREQIGEELEAVKALRAEAAAAVAEAKLAVATAAESASKSLKRKRDELEQEELDATVSYPIAIETPERQAHPLPSKRRRTLHAVRAVARTATVASMGAVAAWAALAFS